MDWLLSWQILRAMLAFGAMSIALVSIIAIWRLRGILNWKRSLKNELNDLINKAELASEIQRQAFKVVIDRCQRIWRASSVEIREILEISSFIRSIARCYHPDVEKPELRISVGRFLNISREVVNRLEMIMHRPGFQRLRRVRIRHIRQSYEWYDGVKKYWFVKYFIRYHMAMKRLFQLRLVIFLDPFSWLFYFSHKLTMLTLTRCLLLDIYFFIGKTAIQAYDENNNEDIFSADSGELERTLEDLDSLKPHETDINDPRIQEIRNRLVGFPSTVISTRKLEEWKKAVNQTANIIAKKYFPKSAHPLEEALIGLILARSRIWIKSLCETETLPVVKRLHRVRIDSLINIKSITDSYLPGQVRKLLKRSWDMYGWIKWPLKVYRWIKKGSPAGISIDIGWVMAKRSFINFVCRHTFDMAYKELEIIYSQSRSIE